jgi:hypothetical protein
MTDAAMTDAPLSAADLRWLAESGIAEAEAQRQLELLHRPPPPARLLRPCTIGDGIRRLTPSELRHYAQHGAEQALAGRVLKMVPASGAATRMFAAPLAMLGREALDREHLDAWAAEEPAAAETRRLLDQLDRMPFVGELARAMTAAGHDLGRARALGELRPILELLLSERGLGYAHRPKGLILFHRYRAADPLDARTALEEQIAEMLGYGLAADDTCRMHLTVGEGHQPLFEAQIAAARRRLSASLPAVRHFEVALSTQSRATDTLALTAEGRLLRDDDGRLLLRPGGHGALLPNLAALGGDLVVIKNIDNVLPQRAQALIGEWKRGLIGLAAQLQERCFALLARLDGEVGEDGELGETGEAAVAEASRFLTDQLGQAVAPEERTAERLRARLDRPLRVCGMVANSGEPGGGPFWTGAEAVGRCPQIVEKAQIDGSDPGQAAQLAAATHFNPVDLVCAPRDRHGRPFPLERFVDPRTAFVTTKRIGGRPLRVLERPGLWNGAMAGWNSVFVEVPAATFAPVKTVLDLLRPEHQPD